MRHRYIIITFVLLSSVIRMSAQALSERYTNARPVVVVSDDDTPPYSFTDDNGEAAGLFVDITQAVARQLDIPCHFVPGSAETVRKAIEHGSADLILTSMPDNWTSSYYVSKSILDYRHIGTDSLVEIRFASRDRQLVEQIDDEFMRLKQDGGLAAIHDHWLHPGRPLPSAVPSVLLVAEVLFVPALFMCLACLMLRMRIRSMARRCADHSKMINQAAQISRYYATEDNQAAHNLQQGYEAILDNPFVAISFYDNNGKLIIQNDTMKRLGTPAMPGNRQPLYNLKGEIANYFVAFRSPVTRP